MTNEGIKMLATAIAIGIGACGPAVAIGMVSAKAMEAIGRNPDAESRIRPNLILSIAFAEAVAIYVLVVALIIIFVD